MADGGCAKLSCTVEFFGGGGLFRRVYLVNPRGWTPSTFFLAEWPKVSIDQKV